MTYLTEGAEGVGVTDHYPVVPEAVIGINIGSDLTDDEKCGFGPRAAVARVGRVSAFPPQVLVPSVTRSLDVCRSASTITHELAARTWGRCLQHRPQIRGRLPQAAANPRHDNK